MGMFGNENFTRMQKRKVNPYKIFKIFENFSLRVTFAVEYWFYHPKVKQNLFNDKVKKEKIIENHFCLYFSFLIISKLLSIESKFLSLMN